MPSIGDLPREPCLKVAKVRRLGCAERTASQREWVQQKAVRSDFQMLPFTSAMKMMESSAACQGVRVAERSQEGNAETGVVTNRFQMAVLLRVNSLEADFLGFIGVVSTNELDTVASADLQAEPGPVTQARGVHTGSSDVC